MGKIRNIGKKHSEQPLEIKTLKNSIFETEGLINTLNKISQCTKFNSNLAWRIHQFLTDIRSAHNTFILSHQKLIGEYAEKDDKGCVRMSDSKMVDIPSERREEFDAKYEELVNTEFTVPLVIVKISDVPNNEFSPSEFGILEKVFVVK